MTRRPPSPVRSAAAYSAIDGSGSVARYARAEPAAEVHERDLHPGRALAVVGEARDDARRLGVGVEAEDLRPDVRVDAAEAQRLRRRDARDRVGGRAGGHREPELRVVGPGLDELVGVGFDAGCDPHQHVAAEADAFQPVDLVGGVGDDAADAGVTRHRDLGVALVVAVHHQAFGREAGVEGDVQLATGGDVEVQTLLGHEPRHRRAEERLARVRHVLGAELLDVGAAPAAQVGLVVDEERGAELARPAAPGPGPRRTAGSSVRSNGASIGPLIVADAGRRRRRRRRRGAPSPRARSRRGWRAHRRGRCPRPPPARGAPG